MCVHRANGRNMAPASVFPLLGSYGLKPYTAVRCNCSTVFVLRLLR